MMMMMIIMMIIMMVLKVYRVFRGRACGFRACAVVAMRAASYFVKKEYFIR